MHIPKIAFAVIWGVLLSACSSVPVKQGEQSSLRLTKDATNYYERGIKALNLWRSGGGDAATLPAALFLLNKAYTARPHDVNVQYAYYDLRFTLAMLTYDDNTEQELLELYEELSPVIRDQFAPPATVTYLMSSRAKKPATEQESHLMRALDQNARSAHAWYNLSKFYTRNSNQWMAVASAQTAARLAPDNAYYVAPLGHALVNIAQARGCSIEQRNLNKQAMTHFLKAAKLAPKESTYTVDTAEQYLALGLLPLAWSQAQKAYSLAVNARTVTIYSKAAIASGRFEEARKVLEAFVADNAEYMQRKTYDAKRISHLLYMLELTSRNEGKRLPKSRKLVSTQGLMNFYGLFSALTMQVNPKLHHEVFADVKPYITRSKVLVDYVEDTSISDDMLLGQAKNTCNEAEYHFAIANRAVSARDYAKSKYHLEQVLSYKDYGSDAYLWAKLILKRTWWLNHPKWG